MRRFALVPSAALVGAVASLEIALAVAEVNEIPLLTRDGGVLLLAALVLVGIPVAIGFAFFSALIRRLSGWSGLRSTGVAALVLLSALAIVYGVLVITEPGPASVALRRNAPLAFALALLAAQSLISSSRRRMALAAASAVASLAMPVLLASFKGDASVRIPHRSRIVHSSARHQGKLLLIGVDGMCWETLRRWDKQEANEDLRWFQDRGYIGPLQTIKPTKSPLVWTSVVTGLPPDKHGVVDFLSWEFKGLRRSRLQIPRFAASFYWMRVLEKLGVCAELPVSSMDMRRPPLWEIIDDPSRPSDVVGLWATWPPQPFNGRLVSDKFYFGRSPIDRSVLESSDPYTTFPPQMAKRLAHFKVEPGEVTADQILSFVDISRAEAESAASRGHGSHHLLSELPVAIGLDGSHFAIAQDFLRDGARQGLFVFYFHGIDLVSHGGMRYSDLYPEVPVSPKDRKRYGKAVSRFYARTFSMLRRLMEAAGPKAVGLIMSDHGFAREEGADEVFDHQSGRTGVVISAGAGADRVMTEAPARVYDVAPTILWLSGYPADPEMPGRALTELFPAVPRRWLDSTARVTAGYTLR